MTWLRVLRERRVSEGRSLRGAEVDSFDDLSDARECAVEHFSKGANEVVVYDYDNDEVIRMDS